MNPADMVELAKSIAFFYNELVANGVNSLTATALSQTLLQSLLIPAFSADDENGFIVPKEWMDGHHQ